MTRNNNRRRVALVLPLCLIHAGTLAAAQNKTPKTVESSLVILTHGAIASVAAIDEKAPARDALVAWIKPVFEAVDSRFAEEKERRTVVVQVTLHPDRAGEVVVAGRPAPTDAEVQAILKVADAGKLPRSRIVDCVLRIVAKVNGGDPDDDKPFSPPLSTPSERRLSEFRAASAPEKLAIMRRWARSEAIPLMALMASDVDPKFQGVSDLGKALKGVKTEGPIDVASLTDKNPAYWRAMLEMAPGIPLVVAVRVALDVANGQIDAARRLAQTLAPFDRHSSGYSALLGEFMAMADQFSREIEDRIRKGIALNDAGKFDEAAAIYDGVLKDYPDSAWCHYERFQTSLMKAMRKNAKLPGWAATRVAILRADPMYGSMAQANTGDELYDLFLRKEIDGLFKDKTKIVPDLVRYADIALDLDQPGIAAIIYWNMVTSVEPEKYQERPLLESMLYCLEQLGEKDLKKNFKGDHAAEFARIDAERAKRRKESVADRVMKQKSK